MSAHKDTIGGSVLDAFLERKIDQECAAMVAEPDTARKRAHFHQMQKLIGFRSQDQINRMEREKGLTERPLSIE